MSKYRNNNGATAIEYACIASGIALVILTGTLFTGTNIKKTFCEVASSIGAGSNCGTSNAASGSGNSSGSSSGSYSYNGVYQTDVDNLLSNLLQHEKAYVDAWQATKKEQDYINTLTDANEVNQLTNGTLQQLKQAESSAYNNIINASDNSGMSEGINQLFSVDYNKSLAEGGQTQAEDDMDSVETATFTSSTGKTYTVGSLEYDNSEYLNGLTSEYPRH